MKCIEERVDDRQDHGKRADDDHDDDDKDDDGDHNYLL